MNLWLENKVWLDQFCAQHGRPPRVLHISNVANNAYNNAKLLNECGLENYVIACNDTYAMGCPEWEDADFDGDVDDLWHPEWSSRDLRGFKRPPWFVQGTVEECICYLIALATGKTASQPSASIREAEKKTEPCHCGYAGLFQSLKLILRRGMLAFDSCLGTRFYGNGKIFVFRSRAFIQKTKLRLQRSSRDELTHHKVSSDEKSGLIGWWKTDAELIDKYSQEFPRRKDRLIFNDFLLHLSVRDDFSRLFNHYDIIIGYAAKGIYPLMSSRPYVAFEHGTIRDIPYEANAEGRFCALVYRLANHVLVTNFDCRKSADYLAPNRYTMINHPFDEDHGLGCDGWMELRADLMSQLDSEFLCFFPTRHDWVAGEGYADKANEVFLKAVGDLRRSGFRVGVVCCEWGRNIRQSKELLFAEGVAGNVMWVKPMGVVRFERFAKACDIVVDQFKLGAFGGVLFKAMAVGAPILTYLNEEMLLRQYPEIPPVVNCRTQKQIVNAVSKLIADPGILDGYRLKSREWIKKFHAKERTANLQLRVFSELAS